MCSAMVLKSNCISRPPGLVDALGRTAYESLKLTVTVMMTGTGTPFNSVGV